MIGLTSSRPYARPSAVLCSAILAIVTLIAVPSSAGASMPTAVPVTSSSFTAPSVLSAYPRMGLYATPRGSATEAQRQVSLLRAQGRTLLAIQLSTMLAAPTATWVTGGTTASVTTRVRDTTTSAAARGQVPVLAAYNLPFRDCSQYSAGGATSVAAYKQWIDAFAAGIGTRPALVIVEPDGLGIIPWYTSVEGKQDWCRPGGAPQQTAAADRFAMLNYAVDKLSSLPRATVYLDGGHSGWLGVGDAASRLVRAGVEKADGFFLNVSNFETTEKQLSYGTWMSKCIHYATNRAEGAWRVGRYTDCASQYYPASPGDTSTWGKTDAWYATNVDAAAGAPSAVRPLRHFVVDTSRNGRGPWTPPSGSYPDAQTWCNPPGRGLGYRPTTATGHPLADAFLWVKVPGESDGQCSRGLTNAAGVDPAWRRVDPPAGAWFTEQALDLLRNAGAPVRP